MRERGSIYFCVLSDESNVCLLPEVEELRCGVAGWVPEVKKPLRPPRKSRCAPRGAQGPSAGLRFCRGQFHVPYRVRPEDNSFCLWSWVGFAIRRLLLWVSVESLVSLCGFDPERMTEKMKWWVMGGGVCFVCSFCF